MSASDLHSAWARLFVSTLASAGIRDVVVSPGSRSTPLALAFAQEPRIRKHIVLDERVAAFFALGQARVSGRPSALLCTSGTAGAHYLPAVIEAAQSHVPMLIVTADRPWEDYDCAAAQTIDQLKLFGNFARHYAELGLPDPAPSALRAVVRIAAQAVHTARTPVPGPVHVNARFRKPLDPMEHASEEPWNRLVNQLIHRGAPTVLPAHRAIDPEAVLALSRVCAGGQRGVVVCGPAWCGSREEDLRRAVLALADKTGFPIWAEATSGVRFGTGSQVCGGFDAALRSPSFRKQQRPALLIELGGPVVSAAYGQYLAEHPDCQRVVIAPHGWNDPHGSASLLIFGDPAELLTRVADRLPIRTPDSAWQAVFSEAERRVWKVVSSSLSEAVFSEGQIAQAVVDVLPADSTLVIGNSLPVRDLDLFCRPSAKPLRVLHQRGASGIDGLIAGAAGARSLLERPLALLLGDLSALHDLGGLGVLRAVSGPLAIVVVQNGGGRIFEQLPIGSNSVARPYFGSLFLTAQDVDFSHAAAAFAIPFLRVSDLSALTSALEQAMSSNRPLLIEAVVPGEDGVKRRKRIYGQLATELAQSDGGLGASIATPTETLPGVFWHGFLGSPSLWQPIAKRLGGSYTNDYLPGHGLSPWLISDADFFAVVDALVAQIPHQRFALHGYSLGARLALAAALRHPHRISRLTLVGVDPGIADPSARATRIKWEDSLIDKLLTQGLPEFVKQWEELPLFDSQQRLSAEALAAQRTARLGHQPQALSWVLRTLGTGRMPDLWPMLPSLSVPTLVLTGALDQKFSTIGTELAKRSSYVTHQLVANAGHNLIVEVPDLVCSELQSKIPFHDHHGASNP